jgi:hypothetical protein
MDRFARVRTMRLAAWSGAAALAVLALACSGGRPSAAGNSPGPPALTEVDSGAPSGEDAAPMGNEAATADVEASAGDGGDAGSANAGSGPGGSPLCSTTVPWAGGHAWVSDPTLMRFAGVASTELTVAWMARGGIVRVADRANPFSDFGQPVDVPLPQIENGSRPALDAAGNQIVLVAPNGTDLVVLARPSARGMWASGSSAAFAAVSAAAVQAGAKVFEPALGSSGRSFFYLLVPPTGVAALYESTWDAQNGRFGAGTAAPNTELASDASHWRRPTGVSSDDRTLFFFDESVRKQRAAWRTAPGSPFTTFVDVPAAPEAAPNAACSVLYLQSPGGDAGSPGISSAQQ